MIGCLIWGKDKWGKQLPSDSIFLLLNMHLENSGTEHIRNAILFIIFQKFAHIKVSQMQCLSVLYFKLTIKILYWNWLCGIGKYLDWNNKHSFLLFPLIYTLTNNFHLILIVTCRWRDIRSLLGSLPAHEKTSDIWTNHLWYSCYLSKESWGSRINTYLNRHKHTG